MWTLLNVFGLLVLLQVTWCAPDGDIAVELEEGNTIYPLEADNDTLSMIEEGEPNEFFLKEVREYFEARKDREHSRVTKRHTYATIYSSDTIALQTCRRYQWVSCWDNICDSRSCPGMFMDPNDYTGRCAGEVFKIYGVGPGAILAGDLVGIYYPYQAGHWLGCAAGSSCGKAPCPGYATLAYGFANRDKWYQCWGEVYRIYARGKNIGVPIQHNDDIRLYYIYNQNWVSSWDGQLDRRPCPGHVRPPTVSHFDDCYGETFKIWKRQY